MALLWVEGFETDQTLASWNRKYTGTVTNTSPSSFVNGRFGGKAARSADENDFILSSNHLGYRQTLVFGIAYRCNLPQDGTGIAVFTGQGGVLPLYLVQKPHANGVFFNLRTKGSTLYSSPVYDYGKWIYLEVWAILENPSTQTNTIFRINGTEVYSASANTGANTVAPGYTSFTLTGRSDPDGYVDLDDFYLLDHAGLPNFFLTTGYSTLVEAMLPERIGTNVEWTPSGVDFNFQAVDDAATGSVNDDTDYNEGDNATDLDLHPISNLRFINGKVHGIEASTDARGSSTPETIDLLIQTGVHAPSELVSPTFSTAYARARTVHTTNPSDGLPFYPLSLRDSQIGYGAKENFVIDEPPPVDPPPVGQDFDYGTIEEPSGTEADFGTTTAPGGPDGDFGTL